MVSFDIIIAKTLYFCYSFVTRVPKCTLTQTILKHCTGTGQSFTIPAAGTYCFECWGAQGGHSTYGGKGGYTKGNIHLDDETFYIYVGATTGGKYGGFNGGGNGGRPTSSSFGGYGGGGATDIRLVDNNLKSRIMVAAGGGGADYWKGWASGGYGGGTTGGYGSAHHTANTVTPATQIKGGVHCTRNGQEGTDGSFGAGGHGCYNPETIYGGGGGGGYWGGAGGSNNSSDCDSGSGGSSFVSGHSGCTAVISASSTNPRTTAPVANHYSGYVFSSGTTITAGNVAVPQTTYYETTSTETGHSGDGFARITQISVD